LPDIIGYDPMTLFGGVDAVGLIELRDAAYTLQEKVDEGGLVLCGQLGEDIVEGGCIGAAHGGEGLHSCQDDFGGGVFSFNGVDDGLQIGSCCGDGNAPEAVIGAQFQHEDVDRLAEDPADAAFAACGSFAAKASVDDLIWPVEGVDAAADDGREGLVGAYAVAGGEAIAEEEDGFGGGRIRGCETGRWRVRGGPFGGILACGEKAHGGQENDGGLHMESNNNYVDIVVNYSHGKHSEDQPCQ